MKRLIALTMVALFAFGFQVEAQDCDQGKKLAEKTWEKWGPWEPNLQLAPFKRGVQKLKNEWNGIASNNGSAIGPRFLEVDGGNENGTIMDQNSSTFVTPPSFYDKMEVTINKFNGKAQTGLVICAMGHDGILTQLETFTFLNNKNGQTKKFNLNSVRGKIIIVAMKNMSAGNRFQYRINAK
jgi:hypothetical protein